MNNIVFHNNIYIRNTDKVKELVNKILCEHKINITRINIIFINNNYMRELNNKFRNINKTTDVLTFSFDAGDTMDLLGEIYICVEYIENRETIYIIERIIHGVLHLSGLTHNTKDDYKSFIKKQKKYITFYNKS